MKSILFCQTCQERTAHEVDVLKHDYSFTCDACGRFIKFARTNSVDDLKERFAEHERNVKGQPIAAPNKEVIRPSKADALKALKSAGLVK